MKRNRQQPSRPARRNCRRIFANHSRPARWQFIARMVGANDDRDGTVLVIVLALLGALTLMGFLIYTIAAEDEVSAEYFADAARVTDPGIDPNSFFNFTLRQIILGADINERQSALWGGRHSLLPTMFGRDAAPFSGEGTNLVWDGGTNVPVVDRDFNNAADADQRLLAINLSASAQGAGLNLNDLDNNGTADDLYPEPDTDYTSPDINSTFLAYDALVPNGVNDPVRVIIPSFHRPQILRNVAAASDWYTDPATQARVLHPHVEHLAFPGDWAVGDPIPTTKRFCFGLADATAAGLNHPFPFPGEVDFDPLTPAPPAAGTEGVWSGTANYEYGADPDGDGVNDAFWMDLDFPLMEVPGTGRKFVAMVAVSVKDADALFNLNAHGNAEGNWALDAGTSQFAGPNAFLSRSNQGAGPWEVNPQWALNARPAASPGGDYVGADLNTALEQYRNLFRDLNNRGPASNPTNNHEGNDYELANMEWWRLLFGGAQIIDPGLGVALAPSDVQQIFGGRWEGNEQRLATNATGVIISRNPANAPFPGVSNADDNRNGSGVFDEGGAWTYAMGSYPAFVHPLDFFGRGRTTTTGSFGKNVALATNADEATIGNHTWPKYANYKAHPDVGLFNAGMPFFNAMMQAASATTLIDEPAETIVSPNAAGAFTAVQKADGIFGPDELLGQLADAIYKTKLNSPGRVAKLAGFNWTDNARAAEIRQRFTSASWDLKSFGKSITPLAGTARNWEFNADTDGDGLLEFPPRFGTPMPVADNLQPFRAELRNLLTLEAGDRQLKLQKLLSVNGVLDFAPSGRLRFRPLTPHPITGLTGAPVVAQPAITRPEQVTSPTQQEWLARFDRQRLARDIYVLLYTMGGSDDAQNYATTPGDTLYPGSQREEMAQFAVNLVDAMDPDDVITQFVFDKDLSDGWDIDDYRYDDPDPPGASHSADRGVVFGVERQSLAFNEAMVVLAKRVLDAMSMTPEDHPATEYNDDSHRNFTYIELENVGPFPVSFANNNWQILIKQAETTTPTYIRERRLTLANGLAQLPAGQNSMLTIGTAGDAANTDGMGTIRPSYMMVDPNNTGDPMNLVRIAPRGTLDLDLLTAAGNTYRVTKPLDAGGAPLKGDGEVVPNLPANPGSVELLDLPATDTEYDTLAEGTVHVEIQLRRRLNMQRPEPATYNTGDSGAEHLQQSKDNPWVVVDQITVPLEIFDLQETDVAVAQIGPKLETLRSKERTQPLYGTQVAGDTHGPDDGGQSTYASPNFRGNSLGENNELPNVTIPYSIWQPHYDRDFATIGELFNVPLWGPFGDTDGVADGQQALNSPTNAALLNQLPTRRIASRFGEVDKGTEIAPALVGDDYDRETGGRMLRAGTAGYRILHPEGANSAQPSVATDETENRWFRALGLLEVPSRMERHFDDAATPYAIDAGQIGGNLGVYRTPGKINLNTLRHPEVLAGLLDDREVFGLDQTSMAGSKRYLFDLTTDTSGGQPRDWWSQFILARDGNDPITGLPLPGVPRTAATAAPNGSRPFRSLNFSQHADVHTGPKHAGSLEHTVFRTLLNDTAGVDTTDERRRLFELGNQLEHDGGAIPYPNRHRLLSKIMNNTTTRSNVFYISIEVAFFEATEVLDPATNKNVVRIGGRIPSTDTFKTSYRGFFVVDRSKAMELLQPTDFPQLDAATSRFVSSFNQRFNYNALVLYRRVIPE